MEWVLVILIPLSLVGFIFLVAYGPMAVHWFINSRLRRRRLARWARAHGFEFDPREDHKIKARYADLDCIGEEGQGYAYNLLTGRCGQREFTGFDYHAEPPQTFKYFGFHYSVVVVASDVPLRPLYLWREGAFDKATDLVGLRGIEFESAEFNRRYSVWAKDPKWAYDVIHPRTMEFLLSLSVPGFCIELTGRYAVASGSVRFRPETFLRAAEVLGGMLDRLPPYVVDDQAARA